jgi:hypothetical protein
VLRVQGQSIEGDDVSKLVAVPMGEGADRRARIRAACVTLAQHGGTLTVSGVKFGSRARKLGPESSYRLVAVEVRHPGRPDDFWGRLAGMLPLALGRVLQGRRMRAADGPGAPRDLSGGRPGRTGDNLA